MKKLAIILLLCGGCVSPNTQAELETFNAIAPEYVIYVEGDTNLTQEQKQLRYDTVETWRRRIEASK
jgi:hypothetical protein